MSKFSRQRRPITESIKANVFKECDICKMLEFQTCIGKQKIKRL